MTVLRDMYGYSDDELSDTWLKLLGTESAGLDASVDSMGGASNATGTDIESPIPVTADPWSELLRAQGVEVVDLQQNDSHMVHIARITRVSFSEQEVEQALLRLQEQ